MSTAEPEINTRLQVLREKMARESAIGTINCFGIPHQSGGFRWFTCEASGFEGEILGEALEYLTLTRRLEWHPKHEDWVRITEVQA